MRTLLDTVLLRPHGRSLLTATTATWLGVVALLAWILALTEAVIWGGIASSYFSETYWPIAIVVGAAVGLIIFAVDSTLVILDLKPLPDPAGSRDGKAMRRTAGTRVAGSFLVRTAIVAIAVVFTAPMAAQLIAASDIDREFSARAEAVRAGLIDGERKRFRADPERLELESELARVVGLWEEELLHGDRRSRSPGRGQSRGSGNGPVARALAKRIDEIKADMARVRRQHEQTIEFMNNASESELARRYGAVFPVDTLANRYQIADQLPGSLPLLTKLFLVILALALIALKLVQPRSAELYFSEYYQSAFREYKNGKFNSYLSHDDLPDGLSPMDGLVFCAWYDRHTQRLEDDETYRRADNFERAVAGYLPRVAKRREGARLQVEKVKRERDQLRRERSAAFARLRDRMERRDRLQEQRDRLTESPERTLELAADGLLLERELQVELRELELAIDNDFLTIKLMDEAFERLDDRYSEEIAREKNLSQHYLDITQQREQKQRDELTKLWRQESKQGPEAVFLSLAGAK
ncbi:MAG: DUF4407 domain-containing protein [Proteobacteria bacterium]|nr:DUF4407 domain-containing protein [Pseudomonadota bacterium]